MQVCSPIVNSMMSRLDAMAGERLADARTGKNGRHALVGMLRQSVFGRLAGYEDVNDAERCAMIRRCAGSSAAGRQGRRRVTKSNGPLRNAMARRRQESLRSPTCPATGSTGCSASTAESVMLDMDSSVSPTHGEQEKSVWNGHFGCTCYHPLSCSTNSAISNDARFGRATFTAPIAGRRAQARRRALQRARLPDLFPWRRGLCDAKMYEYLESEGIEYAIRLPANQILQNEIPICFADPWVGRRITSNACTRRSAIKPGAGA